MRTLLDVEKWSRKDHFHFFNQFEEPFFGVCVDLDCTLAYNFCQETGKGFFLYYLFQCLAAVNEIEAFRLRIEDDKVFLYNEVHASAVINRPDQTFGFSHINYAPEFTNFELGAKKEIERMKNSIGLTIDGFGANIIHVSAMPWLKFTALSHARSFTSKDSCPKISFGKMTEADGKKTMPVSIHVNHALMDGYHVSLFVEEFQKRMNQSG